MTKSSMSHRKCEQTVELAKQAVSRRIRVYVLVNNRSDGNAPLTVQTLVDRLRTDGTV